MLGLEALLLTVLRMDLRLKFLYRDYNRSNHFTKLKKNYKFTYMNNTASIRLFEYKFLFDRLDVIMGI